MKRTQRTVGLWGQDINKRIRSNIRHRASPAITNRIGTLVRSPDSDLFEQITPSYCLFLAEVLASLDHNYENCFRSRGPLKPNAVKYRVTCDKVCDIDEVPFVYSHLIVVSIFSFTFGKHTFSWLKPTVNVRCLLQLLRNSNPQYWMRHIQGSLIDFKHEIFFSHFHQSKS